MSTSSTRSSVTPEESVDGEAPKQATPGARAGSAKQKVAQKVAQELISEEKIQLEIVKKKSMQIPERKSGKNLWPTCI